MKPAVRKITSLFLLLLFILPGAAFCQDITGIWKGSFTTDGGESYRLEFQIAQNKDHTVTGVSYSYGESVRFYGKATMSGRYTHQTKSFLIQETKTVEVKSPGGGTCIMNYRFLYSRSGNEEYLEGSYVGKTEDRLNPANNGVWGDCGAGKVFLRRVQQSDFYVEPFLRNKPALRKKDSTAVARAHAKPPAKIASRPPAMSAKPQPAPKSGSTVKTTPKPVQKNTATTANHTAVRPRVEQPGGRPADSVRQHMPTTVHAPVESHRANIPAVTRARQNELTETLIVTNPEIRVRLYDNGEVDGDSISVYLDGKVIVSNKGLSTVPISITLKMDDDNDEHALVMVAENMGRIPPNTALMIVQDGDKRYQVNITTTEQKNAVVRFRYQKKSD